MPPKSNDPSAGYKPQPLSAGEIDSILDRINEMSSTVHEVLNTDPRLTDKIREGREAKRKEEKLQFERERNFNRYNPSQYKRLEDEVFIDKLLKEVDEPAPLLHKKITDLTNIETISLREAERLKAVGNTHVGKHEWRDAFEQYGIAIELDPQDLGLCVALHNNRAMAGLKCDEWLQAVEDATWVLSPSGGNEPYNVKALLRRAAALVQLHRPQEALRDCKVVLTCDSKNTDVKAILSAAQEEEKELLEYAQVFGTMTAPRATTSCPPTAGGQQSSEVAVTAVQSSAYRKQSAELAQDIEDKITEALSLVDELLPPPAPQVAPQERTKEETKLLPLPDVLKDERTNLDLPLPTVLKEETKETKGGEDEKKDEEKIEENEVAVVCDQEKLTAVCNSLCEVSALVGSVYIAGVQLRTRDSTTIPKLLELLPVCETLLLSADANTAGSSKDHESRLVTSLVMTAALYRLLSHVYQHHVARSMLEQKRDTHKDVMVSLLKVAVESAKAERPIVVPAALELISSMCLSAKGRQVVIPLLSPEDMSDFVSGGTKKSVAPGNQAAALKLLEKLFLEPSGATKFESVAASSTSAGGGLLSTVLAQIQSGHTGQMEAAAPMLLRLSADAEFVPSMNQEKSSGFSVVVAAVKREMHLALEHSAIEGNRQNNDNKKSSKGLVKVGGKQKHALVAHTRPFLLEALLAVLFNALRSSAANKVELSALFFKELLHTRFVAYLEAFTLIQQGEGAGGNDESSAELLSAHPRDELWNVVARLTGVLAKMAGANEEVKDYLITNKSHGGLQPLLGVLTLSCKHLQPSKAKSAASASVLTATDDAYKATTAENTTLTLAIVTRKVDGVMALWSTFGSNSNDGVGLRAAQELVPVLRFDLQSSQTGVNARTVGNAALVIPLLDVETLKPKETVSECLESVKALRTRTHQLDSAVSDAKAKVKSFTTSTTSDVKLEADANVKQLEQERAEANAAMKNVGIALSKLAKTEAFLTQLRDQRGIEILATALKE